MSITRQVRASSRRKANGTREARKAGPTSPVKMIVDLPDILYIVALVALISVGAIMVYSTTLVTDGPNKVIRSGIWLGLGLIAMAISAAVPIRVWRKVAPALLIAGIAGLIFVKIPGNPLAPPVNGASRWIKLPGVGQVQPSEFVKLAFVLYAAQFLERRGHRMKGKQWLTFGGVLAVIAGLIYKEPDLGTALVIVGTAWCMLVAAGTDLKVIGSWTLVGAVLIGLLAWYTPHQQRRLLAWQNPWAEEYRLGQGMQVNRAWSAMARGGLYGVGLGQSFYKVEDRLPESETDFIFAILAEELGMLRAAGVIILFGVLAWRGYGIAARSPDRYASLVVAGITSWIAVQSCLNLAVVTGTVPNTGVPLPFISSGGSSLVSLMTATGIVIGISRLRRPEKSGGVPVRSTAR